MNARNFYCKFKLHRKVQVCFLVRLMQNFRAATERTWEDAARKQLLQAAGEGIEKQ